MNIDKVLQATLLLTVFFNKKETGKVKPLTPAEYGRFATWLHQQGASPADLLNDAGEILKSWIDPKNKITQERISELLARGASMGFALEQWQKHGVWVLSRSSPDYPRGIRKHLGDTRPPVLFGIGNKSLLNNPGIGFVGSRTIEETDAALTQKLASLAVGRGFCVISGGAKGIDQTAMEAAINHGGQSVGVLSDSLLKASTLRIYREAIQNDQLVLISPYYPEAGFSTGNAMGRNKYIYTLSQAVVAVRSDFEKGGTWAGAVENQKKGWVPLLVPDSVNEGNQALIKQGAMVITDSFSDFQEAIDCFSSTQQAATSPNDKPVVSDLFPTSDNTEQTVELKEADSDGVEEKTQTEEQPPSGVQESLPTPENDQDPDAAESTKQGTDLPATKSVSQQALCLDGTPLENYGEVFAAFMTVLTEIVKANRQVTPNDLQERLPELPETLIKKWLAELAEHKLLEREGRKISYTFPEPDLFH